MPPILLKTSKLARSYPCRAFYDSGGDSISVGVKQKGKFGACLEGDEFSFDLTKDGKLLNIDVWKPRQDWKVEKAIHPPEHFDKEDVAFVGARLTCRADFLQHRCQENPALHPLCRRANRPFCFAGEFLDLRTQRQTRTGRALDSTD